MNSSNTDAHIFWDTQWADPKTRAPWQIPEDRVIHTIASLRQKKSEARLRALDLGCGAGRHVVAMIDARMDCYACDASRSSAELVTELMAQRLVVDRFAQANMTSLPYQNNFFDYVLSWNVLYHGSRAELELALSEVRRVLRSGALFEATFISKRNDTFGKGVAIDPHTWIDQRQDDKAHAHSYADREDLENLLTGFSVLEIEEYEQKSYAGAWHWYIKAQKD